MKPYRDKRAVVFRADGHHASRHGNTVGGTFSPEPNSESPGIMDYPVEGIRSPRGLPIHGDKMRPKAGHGTSNL
jgi:hypothetical protein